MEHNKRSSFSGKLGYVLSAAGASVGLGNIWRFPYLAAKYGGGIFLLIYILLALTFGYTMIVAETAIGRMTRKARSEPLRIFRQIEMAVCRRLDQCDHSCADRTVLFCNRWLGHQISGGIYQRKWSEAGSRRLFFRFYFKWSIYGNLLCCICAVYTGDHLCGCA